MTPVVLWDIDGTLVRSGPRRVSVNAFLRALRLVGNLPDDSPYPTDSGGKTDEQIALEVLLSADIAEQTALDLLPDFRQAYLDELERDRDLLIGDLRVLPGVPEVLAALQARGVTQSLLTGNLEPIARLKLAAVGLDRYVEFDVGAYGSDHRDRTCLVPITRERLGARAEDAEIVVVGDTPRDVACARVGGARAIAVATGSFSRAELAAHQPDALLEDLSDTTRVIETLLAGAPAVHLRGTPRALIV